MVYGYARVSTRGQAKDGNSLEAQENALRSAGATKIYADAFTGTRTKRPELDKLMSVLQSGDTGKRKLRLWSRVFYNTAGDI